MSSCLTVPEQSGTLPNTRKEPSTTASGSTLSQLFWYITILVLTYQGRTSRKVIFQHSLLQTCMRLEWYALLAEQIALYLEGLVATAEEILMKKGVCSVRLGLLVRMLLSLSMKCSEPILVFCTLIIVWLSSDTQREKWASPTQFTNPTIFDPCSSLFPLTACLIVYQIDLREASLQLYASKSILMTSV